jgi:Zn2+/Cd2+-exporting ATPase
LAADARRPESVDIIRALHKAGVEHVVMLTGDNKPTADRIVAATGIEEVRAELLPADKVKAVEELVERFGTVAMIGDGVNDAPAMGRASLGMLTFAGAATLSAAIAADR